MSSKAELEPHKLLWQQDINLIAEIRTLPSTFGRMYCINVVNAETTIPYPKVYVAYESFKDLLTKTTNQEDEKKAIWNVLTTRMIVVSHTVTGIDGKKSTRDYIKLQKNIHTGETPELALQKKKVRADTNIERVLKLYDDTTELGVRLTPVSAAIYANDEESANILINHLHRLPHIGLGEVDTCGRNALHMAAKYGCSLPLFHKILNSIYDVNAGNNWKMTALMFAANNKHLELVTALMKYPGIDLNFQGNFSQTALHYAVKIASPAIVAQLLSDSRIDTSLKDSDKRTPLMLAIEMGRDECAKILREHGASDD